MSLRQTPLAAVHGARGASMTGFGGWEMPVEYDGIRREHVAVRTAAGKFDVSHMGEIEVTGPDAVRLTNRLVTNDVAALDPGEGLYAMITDQDGVILDDTIVYRRGPEDVLFVPNAGHDVEMADRWTSHRDAWGLDAAVSDVTEDWAMIAVQGPDAPELVAEAADGGVIDLARSTFADATVAGVPTMVSRTGYTGEDGFELLVPWDDAEAVWDAVDCQPCGLGARDTLRLEMGFLLSGQDFHPAENPRNPYEAGVGSYVKLGTDFVGRDALERVEMEGVEETLAGLMLIDRGVPRHGYEIADTDGTPIGEVTSGTVSPTLDEPIGLGYVPVEYADPETPIRVVIRGASKKAKIHATPFLPDR